MISTGLTSHPAAMMCKSRTVAVQRSPLVNVHCICSVVTVICSFRLDRYRGDPKEEHNDCFEFECHIYVDDAFMTEKGTEKRLVNEYVKDLIQVVIEVYR